MEKHGVSSFWKGLSLFLMGVLLGVLISPSQNGNNNSAVTRDTNCETDG